MKLDGVKWDNATAQQPVSADHNLVRALKADEPGTLQKPSGAYYWVVVNYYSSHVFEQGLARKDRLP